MLQKFDERNRDLLVNINGELVHRDKAGISPFDSAVQGGDAVWEGLRLYNGRIFKLHEHLERLERSAHGLSFAEIPPSEKIIQEIKRTLTANKMRDSVHIRLTLTRGIKITSGMDPRLNQSGPTLIVLAEHKIEANNAGADDALMLDTHGFVAETNATHVFIVRNGDLATSRCVACPEGITRAMVIEICAAQKIRCIETDLSVVDVYGANEIFCTGTMGELAAVTKIDNRQIGDGSVGPMTKRLSDLYAQRTASEGVQVV